MERVLDYLKNLENHTWLIADNSDKFQQIAAELYLELIQKSPQKIILAEREPVRFLASFIAACAANCPVFLCNPDWGKQEWQQVFDLVQPDIILGMENEHYYQLPITNYQLPIPHSIMIPTGGSSGQIKFAIHTWETLIASVQGFTAYFQLKQVNSVCVLPLYHVSGLMQFMRSFTTGGKLAILPFKLLESSQIDNIQPADFFISLVPTQLQHLLESPELTQWISQFQTVLLGGAPAWEELLEKSRFHNIKLAPTYGMTETASQIATLKPDDFLKGKISSGQILPHAQVTIHNQKGEILKPNQTGNIKIQSTSLALGYYPQPWENQDKFSIDDLGYLDEKGYLNIVGRSSNKIISGGENIYPAEIELAIRQTNIVADICVIGIPDKHWGQAVTAIYIPKNSNTSTLQIQTLLKDKLSKFKIPKYWIPLQTLPRNAQGKINHQQLQQIAQKFLSNPIT
ncbi:acyl-CoA synthetase (AMP-forming)/AMP-acid ligase II [Cylindrospermum stagnale PCC 7417]|uniref:Acyl-CoA synthetase (AMP-forming)/AMP-acid ligase II n=1 Tax=Cylindrospermum stagnale PCC 7417 TaxID=56107 RepID=K9X6S2_9NOST|nr:2-succinylbenzoate--CoA ligase [Cylindrospermum stagnale]AFZ27776.1 acyl-CoA synthetase (AMP-forming)/AMP-acid ligase II [Cylindrospermum stagnale PCC 7417]